MECRTYHWYNPTVLKIGSALLWFCNYPEAKIFYCTKITNKQMNNKDSIFATCYCICSLFTNGAFIWSLIIHFSFQQREYCTAISNNFCSHWEYIILLSLHFASVGCNKWIGCSPYQILRWKCVSLWPSYIKDHMEFEVDFKWMYIYQILLHKEMRWNHFNWNATKTYSTTSLDPTSGQTWTQYGASKLRGNTVFSYGFFPKTDGQLLTDLKLPALCVTKSLKLNSTSSVIATLRWLILNCIIYLQDTILDWLIFFGQSCSFY